MSDEIIKSVSVKPGAFLKKCLSISLMTSKELSLRIGCSEKYISGIISGKERISQDYALKFEQIFNVPAIFWIRTQVKYDEFLNRIDYYANVLPVQESFYKEHSLSKLFNFLKKFGYIKSHSESKVQCLLDFFSVTEFRFLDGVFDKQMGMAWSNSSVRIDKYAFLAWLTCGRNKLREISLPPYDQEKLKENLIKVRKYASKELFTVLHDVEQLFAEAGVFLCYTPLMPGSNIHGFTEWIDGIPVIHISMGHTIDCHWHVIFHEAKHVIQNKRKTFFISAKCKDDIINDEKDKLEIEAHFFAANMLISDNELIEFSRKKGIEYIDPAFAEIFVCEFAKQHNLHPAIVIGRLQHLKKIPWASRMNRLKSNKK